MKRSDSNFGIVLNYILIMLTNISSLVLTPTLISGMGKGGYGIYQLVFSVMTLMIVADFGIGTAMIKNLANYNAEGDGKGRENFLYWSFFCYLIFMGAAVVFCVLLGILSPFILRNFTGSETALYMKMLAAMGANTVVLFFQNYFFSVIAGFEKFIYTRICNIARVIARTGLFYAMVVLKKDPASLFLVDIALNILILILYVIYVKKLDIRIKNHGYESSEFKKNIKNMLSLYIMPVAENSYWMLSNLIIAAVFGPDDVTIFALAATFGLIFQQIIGTISYFKMPKVSNIWNNREEFREKYVFESSCFQAALSGAVLIGFTVFGHTFLKVWTGISHETIYYIGLVMMSALFFPLSQAMLEMVLYAQNKYFWRAALMVLTTVLNTVLMLFFSRAFGIFGTAAAVFVSMIVVRFVLMDVLYIKSGLGFKKFTVGVVFRILPLTAAAMALGIIVDRMFFENMGLTLLLGLAIFIVYLFSLYFFYLPDSQKQDLRNLIFRRKS